MMCLIDTNVFLEILLTQEKRDSCKKFLEANIGKLCISDFSIHSIGVILFRNNKEDIFKAFTKDVIPKVKILTLTKARYDNLSEIKKVMKLDFDDAYQYEIAKEHGLEIVTMDDDFKKIGEDIKVLFL